MVVLCLSVPRVAGEGMCKGARFTVACGLPRSRGNAGKALSLFRAMSPERLCSRQPHRPGPFHQPSQQRSSGLPTPVGFTAAVTAARGSGEPQAGQVPAQVAASQLPSCGRPQHQREEACAEPASPVSRTPLSAPRPLPPVSETREMGTAVLVT